MIELLWKNLSTNDKENMMYVTNLIAWLTTSLAQEKEYHKIVLSGYFTLIDKEGTFATLLVCYGKENQNQLLKILQQPPDEYKEKYVACVPSEEPCPVKEEENKKSDENIINVSDET